MNIALILAGGTDPKFQLSVPKQFVNVDNRPIIIYTLQAFEKNAEIDEIYVSCLSGWQEMVKAYAKQFNITKLKGVIPGGESGQASSRNGVNELAIKYNEDDIVILHDAIRPLVSEEVISDCIRVCKSKGMGVAAVPSRETIMKTVDGKEGSENISRFSVMKIQTPQAFLLGDLEKIHKEALKKGICNEWEMSSVVAKLGKRVYFSRGADVNMKISTMEDVEMFRVLRTKKDKKKI